MSSWWESAFENDFNAQAAGLRIFAALQQDGTLKTVFVVSSSGLVAEWTVDEHLNSEEPEVADYENTVRAEMVVLKYANEVSRHELLRLTSRASTARSKGKKGGKRAWAPPAGAKSFGSLNF